MVGVQIGGWLGMNPPVSETDILRIVEQQLAPSVIERLVSLGVDRSEVDTAIIPLRTLQHRRSKHEQLTVAESDRVVRLIRALSEAEVVYGSREAALAWFRTPNARLDDRTPLTLLNTDTGTRLVEQLLVQIDDGMFI